MIEVAAGQLHGRTAVGRHDEYMLMPGFEIALAVRSIRHRLDHLCPGRPLCVVRGLGRLDERLVFVGHEHDECEQLAVR